MEHITGFDVVLTFSPIDEITGHVFEVFDYYLFLRDYYKVGMLFLGNMSPDKLKIAFESKYIVPFDEISKDFIYYSKEQLMTRNTFYFDNNTVVLVTDGNIHALQTYRIKLLTKKLLGFLCFNREMFMNTTGCSMYKHMTYLQDYRIYGRNQNFKSYNYVKKLPFKYYRKSTKIPGNTGLMYVTYACRKVTPQIIQEYHDMSGCEKTLLVVPYKLDEYDYIKGVEQVLAPLPDFFDQFDTYIYTPVHRKFDCSPRLVTECFLQNKKIFMHLDYMDIGLQTRYDDCVNNLESLNLKDGDMILEIISDIKSASYVVNKGKSKIGRK